MNTIDHGSWVRYVPVATREDAPSGTMFARRESDGQDWYEYVHPGTNFGAGHVVIAAYWVANQNSYIVGPATYSPTAIFPQNCIVHELTDYSGSDPQADLGAKCFDPATGAFTDPVVPPPPRDDPVMRALADIQKRLDALESK